MIKNEIEIGGVTYKLGCNLNTRILYERMSGKMLGDTMLTMEHIVFFFASLTTFNKGVFTMDFESFMNLLVDNEKLLGEFTVWEIAYFKSLSPASEEPEKSGKKKG